MKILLVLLLLVFFLCKEAKASVSEQSAGSGDFSDTEEDENKTETTQSSDDEYDVYYVNSSASRSWRENASFTGLGPQDRISHTVNGSMLLHPQPGAKRVSNEVVVTSPHSTAPFPFRETQLTIYSSTLICLLFLTLLSIVGSFVKIIEKLRSLIITPPTMDEAAPVPELVN